MNIFFYLKFFGIIYLLCAIGELCHSSSFDPPLVDVWQMLDDLPNAKCLQLETAADQYCCTSWRWPAMKEGTATAWVNQKMKREERENFDDHPKNKKRRA